MAQKPVVKKPVTVQYRYMKTEDLWDTVNLKEIIVEILRRTPGEATSAMSTQAKLRLIDLDQDGSVVLLNQLSDPNTWDGRWFAGQLIHLKPGTEIAGITTSLDETVETFELQNLNIGEQNQIVNGVLYFAIVDNHVALIEDQKARGRTLERYLTRMLERAGEFETGQTVILNAKLQGALQQVNQITISPKPSSVPSPADELTEQSTEVADEEGHGSTVLDVLRALGWQEDELYDLQAQVPAGGWLEGAFKVIFKENKTRRAKVDRAALEQAIRNFGPEAVGLSGGGSEQGGLMKLSDKKRLPHHGSLVDPEEAMTAIVASLRKWAHEGLIDCNFDGVQ